MKPLKQANQKLKSQLEVAQTDLERLKERVHAQKPSSSSGGSCNLNEEVEKAWSSWNMNTVLCSLQL